MRLDYDQNVPILFHTLASRSSIASNFYHLNPFSSRCALTSSLLPTWLQALQALALPMIAAVGAWVAVQQMLIAKIKLRHELYERRYAVFQAVRTFLGEAFVSKAVSDETLRAFLPGTADAEFLFPAELAEYLKEMSRRARLTLSIQIAMPGLDPRSEQAAQAGNTFNTHRMWLNSQVEGLSAKFQPWLNLDHRRGHRSIPGALRTRRRDRPRAILSGRSGTTSAL
jgi:hypothetical protein